MKKALRILLLCAMILCMVPLAAQSATLSDVTPLLEKIESAYNRMDLNLLLECYDPSVLKAFTAMGKFVGMDTDLYTGLMPFASNIFSAYIGSTTDLPQCKITPDSYIGDDYYGVVKYKVEIKQSSGNVDNITTEMNVQKVDNVWYIAAFQEGDLRFARKATEIQYSSDITEEDIEKGPGYFTKEGNGNNYLFINAEGKVIYKANFQKVLDSKDGIYPVNFQNGGWGFVDYKGNTIVGDMFDSIMNDGGKNGYWRVKKNYKWGAISITHGTSINCEFDDIGYVSEAGYAVVKKGDYWGVVDTNGNTVLDFIYSDIEKEIKHDLAIVRINNAEGVLDMQGNPVIPLSDENIINIQISSNGLILVLVYYHDNGTNYYSDRIYDSAGTEVYETDWSTHQNNCSFYDIDEEYCYFEKHNHDNLATGWVTIDDPVLYNSKGEVIMDYTYDLESSPDFRSCKITPLEDGNLIWSVEKSKFEDQYSAVINIEGNKVIKETYPTSNPVIKQCNNIYFVNWIVDMYNGRIYILTRESYDGFDPKVSSRWIWFEKDKLFDTKTKEAYKISHIDRAGNYAFIVSDGVFKGLITDKGLVGNGIKYTDIQMINDRSFYLDYGNDRIRINIGLGGEPVEYDGFSNRLLEVNDLDNGQEIIWEPTTKINVNQESTDTSGEELENENSFSTSESGEIIQTENNTDNGDTEMEEPSTYLISENGEMISLYQGPGEQFSIISQFMPGTVVDVLSNDGTWAYVIIDVENGFVMSNNLSDSNEAEEDEKVEEQFIEEIEIQVTDNPFFENEEEDDSPEIEASETRTTVEENLITPMPTQDNTPYITYQPETTSAPVPITTDTTSSVSDIEQSFAFIVSENGQTIRIRERDKKDSKVVTQVPSGCIVTLLERGETWSKIQYQNKSAYVMSKFLKDQISVGGSVIIGNYEQDNKSSNGKEPIEWVVLDKDEEGLLLISKYALDCRKFHPQNIYVSWSNSNLREWLNNDFFNIAFSDSEKQLIQEVYLEDNVVDKVFLLSASEAERYFSSAQLRRCAPTKYAIANGAFASSKNKINGQKAGWWWLRSQGTASNRIGDVNSDGTLDDGQVDSEKGVVRPAIKIILFGE